ncbi:MAG: hypothetical protein Q4B40_07325 [Clostridia bacterium]|nr:hypothetical protein [Clostridia bacterium]
MLKKVTALTLVLIMIMSATGCRKLFGNSSSIISDITILENSLPTAGDDSTTPTDGNTQGNSQKPVTNSNAPQQNRPNVDYSGKVPSFTNKEYEISAFWCPYDISVAGLTQYKNAGFNTLFTGNHSLSWTSENQFYLGSKRTMTALENAKKVGLDVILNYNDWIAEGIEGKDYYGDTPFSKHDVYGAYKDIIVGIHMVDEPGADHIAQYGKQSLINDFKKVYPNAKYVVNLLPEYALDYREWDTAEQMYNSYYNGIMSKFDNNRMISIDCYFFHKQYATTRRQGIMKNYDNVAKIGKKYNASQTFIMQTAVGNEFDSKMSEADIRLQANMAMAFGADAMQYYCYSVPIDTNRPNDAMYDYCILKPDNTPSPLYTYVKNVNAEAQKLADILLSYTWQEATGIEGKANVAGVGEFYDIQAGKFQNTKHFGAAKGTQDIVMSRFTSDKYGEGYMLVNFAQREQSNTVDLQLRDCGAVAVYGGAGFNGTPKIINLDNNNMCQINLKYGEGVFLVPLS